MKVFYSAALKILYDLSQVFKTWKSRFNFPQPSEDLGGLRGVAWPGTQSFSTNQLPQPQQNSRRTGLWVIANLHFNSQIQIKPKVVIKEKMKMRIKVIPHSWKRRD